MSFIAELKYLKSNEVPSIPHRVDPMRVAVYAPLDRASFAPEVVPFRGNARQIMLVTEAARHSGKAPTAAEHHPATPRAVEIEAPPCRRSGETGRRAGLKTHTHRSHRITSRLPKKVPRSSEIVRRFGAPNLLRRGRKWPQRIPPTIADPESVRRSIQEGPIIRA